MTYNQTDNSVQQLEILMLESVGRINIVDNQSITLEDRKQTEMEYRELEESTDMDQACCDTCLKLVYADDLQIAKLMNESKTNNVAYSATLI
jgi:hypothetical protein